MFLRKSFMGFNAFFSVLGVILRSKASCVNYLLVVLCVVSLVNGDSTKCDRHLTDSSGDITSPNYPDKYPVSTSCSWKIVAPPYDKIQLTFIVFEVKAGSSQSVCDKDFVEIIDGTRSLGKYCNGHDPPGTIHSDSNLLTVIFKSNSLARDPKEYFMFHASYEREPCGEYLTGLKGEISSPNNPGPYPVPKHCTWKIQVPPDRVIVLYFLVFALEPTSYCNLDYIRAIDGFNTTSRLIGHFCAKRKPRNQIRSTNNQMVLDFHAFKPTESAGFHAFYEAHPHCGGILRGSTGTFTSPSVLQKCTWKIEVSQGEIISIVFDISSTINNNHCGDDFVEVFDGKDESSLSLGRYCSKPANSVHSSGNRMIVKLHHSHQPRGLSFSASYTAVDPKNMYYQCSETSDELLYKCDNGNYIQCQWKCDDTDDCGDRSDEKNCGKKKTTPSSDRSKLRNYVIILVSITGSAVVIFLVVFFVDRLRKKRRSQATRRRRRRRARRALDAVTGEPSSPPPPYDFAVSTSSCCDVTGNPPTYTQAVSPVNDSESGEIGTADVEHSDQVTVNDGLSEQITFNDGENTTQISQDNLEVILGESPPSSDTAPLIV